MIMKKKVYVISYSFLEKKGDYTALYQELSSFESWWHKLDNTWLVYSELDSKQIYQKLSRLLDNNIYLIINEVNSNCYGWLPPSGWEWLKKYTNVTL